MKFKVYCERRDLQEMLKSDRRPASTYRTYDEVPPYVPPPAAPKPGQGPNWKSRFKDFMATAAITAAGPAAVGGMVSPLIMAKYADKQQPTAMVQPQQEPQGVQPQADPFGDKTDDGRYVGGTDEVAAAVSASIAKELKLPKPPVVTWEKAGDYIKKAYGKNWPKAWGKASMAQIKDDKAATDMGLPKFTNLNKPVAVVHVDPAVLAKLNAGAYCSQIPVGSGYVTACVMPTGDTDPRHKEEEYTHSLQTPGGWAKKQVINLEIDPSIVKKYGLNGAGSKKTFLDYTNDPGEFWAKAAQMKRVYHQMNGDLPPDAKTLVEFCMNRRHEIKNYNITQFLYLFDMAKENDKLHGTDYFDQYLKLMDKYMDHLVAAPSDKAYG